MKYPYLAFSFLTIFGLSLAWSQDNNEVLNNQQVRHHNKVIKESAFNSKIIKTIGNFDNGKREGVFVYIDDKGKFRIYQKIL